MAEKRLDRSKLDKKTMGIEPGLPLEASSGGIEDLRRDVQRLMDMEAIRQLKHAYFRCIDTCNLEELATLFHDEVTVHFIGGTYEWQTSDKQEYVKNIGEAFTREAVGHHNGHHPEIQMLSDSEATGLWYLADVMYILEHNFRTTGTAIYWDRYVKENGRWLIKETRYERLYEHNELLEKRPDFDSHYLSVHGPESKAG